MSFNDPGFWLVLPLIWLLYYFARGFARVLTLAAASLAFYGFLNPQFLIPLFFAISADFMIAQAMGRLLLHKKKLLIISLFMNLGLLAYFKYLPFIFKWDNILFPIGISFYTFQSIGYMVDVYREKLAPITNAVEYVLFVCFFPQLVLGPIEKANVLLPQLQNLKRPQWQEFSHGIQLIIWGLFKKVVIADRIGEAMHLFFQGKFEGVLSSLATGAAVIFQVYADFSGYSDIALGLGFLFGVRLTRNFKPFYVAKNPTEYWNRWHLSLTLWIREYLMRPLLKKFPNKPYMCLFVVFMAIAIWHGLSWNWIFYGLFNFFSVSLFFKLKKIDPHWVRGKFARCYMILFYVLNPFLYQVAVNDHVTVMTDELTNFTFGGFPKLLGLYIWIILPLILIERFMREDEEVPFENSSPLVKFVFLSALITSLFYLGKSTHTGFLYYQF